MKNGAPDKGARDDAGLDTEFHRGLGLFDATMVVVGSMIGSGIFIVPATMARELGSPGWLARRLADHRRSDRQRRPILRRTSSHDAAGRRAVSLSARGILAAVGLPLRLDAVSRHSDGLHRGGGRRLRALRRRPVAGPLRGSLSPRSLAPERGLCPVAVLGPTGRRGHDRPSDRDEHRRSALRQARAEPVHPHQNGSAAGPDRGWSGARLERRGGARATSAICGRREAS